MNYDKLLQDVAGVLNGGTMTIPSHVAFTDTEVVVNPAETTLSGEYGSRASMSSGNVLNITTYSGVRAGATASSDGDTINAIGLFNSSGSGDLYAVVLVPSLLHTTDFDFEIDWSETVTR